MNQIAVSKSDRRQVATVQPEKPSRAITTAKALETVDATYLEAFRAFERLGAKVRQPGEPEPSWPFIATFWLQRPEGGAVRSEEGRTRAISDLESRLAERPDPEQVAQAYDTLVRLRSTIHQAQNRTIIALMLDAFPNARAHSPEAWMETVVKEVRVSEFSTLVVAKACNLLTRSETFAPSVGAVIERCELVKTFVDAAIAGVDRGRLQRQYYDLCLGWLRATSVWDGDPAKRPEPLLIDLGRDPFDTKTTIKTPGRVAWV